MFSRKLVSTTVVGAIIALGAATSSATAQARSQASAAATPISVPAKPFMDYTDDACLASRAEAWAGVGAE